MAKMRIYVHFDHCKRFGHHWDDYNPQQGEWPEHRWPATRYEEFARCTECGTARRFQLDSQGEVLARQYHYPENYRWDADSPKPTRAELRLMAMKRRK